MKTPGGVCEAIMDTPDFNKQLQIPSLLELTRRHFKKETYFCSKQLFNG